MIVKIKSEELEPIVMDAIRNAINDVSRKAYPRVPVFYAMWNEVLAEEAPLERLELLMDLYAKINRVDQEWKMPGGSNR